MIWNDFGMIFSPKTVFKVKLKKKWNDFGMIWNDFFKDEL